LLRSIRGFALSPHACGSLDLADHAGTSALRLDLEQLSSDAGAQLLRALSIKEDATELRRASDEFSGHCLAPTLLGAIWPTLLMEISAFAKKCQRVLVTM
jgi:hypothetical protein